MIKLRVAKDRETGKSYCPFCYEPRTKLMYLHSYILHDHIAYAYQCTNCRRIIWGKENIKIVKGESENEETT